MYQQLNVSKLQCLKVAMYRRLWCTSICNVLKLQCIEAAMDQSCNGSNWNVSAAAKYQSWNVTKMQCNVSNLKYIALHLWYISALIIWNISMLECIKDAMCHSCNVRCNVSQLHCIKAEVYHSWSGMYQSCNVSQPHCIKAEVYHSWSEMYHSWSEVYHSWYEVYHCWSEMYHCWSEVYHSWSEVYHSWSEVYHCCNVSQLHCIKLKCTIVRNAHSGIGIGAWRRRRPFQFSRKVTFLLFSCSRHQHASLEGWA